MTDLQSIAAVIAGLIGLATRLTKACYGYHTKVKNAPVGYQEVIDEIRQLRSALSDLEDICDRRGEPLPVLENLMKELSDCENSIAEFGLKIDKEFPQPSETYQAPEMAI